MTRRNARSRYSAVKGTWSKISLASPLLTIYINAMLYADRTSAILVVNRLPMSTTLILIYFEPTV